MRNTTTRGRALRPELFIATATVEIKSKKKKHYQEYFLYLDFYIFCLIFVFLLLSTVFSVFFSTGVFVFCFLDSVSTKRFPR